MERLWNGSGHTFKTFQLFRKLELAHPYPLTLRAMHCCLGPAESNIGDTHPWHIHVQIMYLIMFQVLSCQLYML